MTSESTQAIKSSKTVDTLQCLACLDVMKIILLELHADPADLALEHLAWWGENINCEVGERKRESGCMIGVE